MQVTQGYNTDPGQGGSHYDCAEYPDSGCALTTWNYKYSLDLVPTSGAAEGTTVLSPVSGTIRWIDTGYGGMSINLGNGWAVALFPHLACARIWPPGKPLPKVNTWGQSRHRVRLATAVSPIFMSPLWQTNDGGNWDRHAEPFAGAQALDGNDFAALGDATSQPISRRNRHLDECSRRRNDTARGRLPKRARRMAQRLTSATVTSHLAGRDRSDIVSGHA